MDDCTTTGAKVFSVDVLVEAFNRAEGETAEFFNGQTCSLRDKEGHDTCPICYFRLRVKEHLGIGV